MSGARVRPNPGSPWLTAAGWLSAAAAILHIACIVGGGAWYRLFGAGEAMARAAERGSPVPALMTAAVAAILAVLTLYAFSGAGRTRRLPLLRTALCLIAFVYLARAALGLVPQAWDMADTPPAFVAWSSTIVLAYGVAYAVGTARAWPFLSQKDAD